MLRPDECLDEVVFFPTASWNAGGGEIIGVIEGGEYDSGILWGEVHALLPTDSKS